jgi:hypothetical protein
MSSDAHIEKLLRSKYHQDGGCVVRHESKRHARCKYVENGFDDLGNHSAQYDSPPRYNVNDAAAAFEKLKQKTLTRKQGGKKVKVKTPVKPVGTLTAIWNVKTKADGIHQNFEPLSRKGQGFHYPYFHNWHHLIGNEMLNTFIKPAKLLEVLMASGYNINDKENIVMLPKQRQVGEIIHWPIHPNNHGPYDDYAEEKLQELKDKLQDGLEVREKPHKVTVKSLPKLRTEMNAISDRLRKILDALGKLHPGIHINRVDTYGAGLEARIAKT